MLCYRSSFVRDFAARDSRSSSEANLEIPQIHFYKYQALGNDYLIIEPDQLLQPLRPNQAILLCDRHYGVGADGVLIGPSFSKQADFSLQIFNPDGSEAEKSGNGLRIFARYLWDRSYLIRNTAAERKAYSAPFSVLTAGGKVIAQVFEDGELIRVEMGQAVFEHSPPTVPEMDRQLETLEIDGVQIHFCAVSLGNPHCVVFYPPASEETARKLGPSIEHNPRFPNRTNVQFLEVINRQMLSLQIWERGAGYTLSSGSSSCAAAAAAYRFGLCDREITVHNPGGQLKVSITPDYLLHLTGPAVPVFEGFLEKL